MQKVSRQADYQKATIMLQNEKDFSDLNGRRTFIWWKPQDKSLGVFLFYPGSLVLYKTTEARLAELKTKLEPLDHPGPFIHAIKNNVSGAKVQGKWDGGVAADGVIKMLETGQWVEDGYWTEAPPPDKPLLSDKPSGNETATVDTPSKRKRGSKAATPAAPAAPGEAAAGTTTKEKEPNVAKKTAKKANGTKPAAAKKEKPKLGRIVLTAKGKEGREGKAGKRFADMVKYMAAHRTADAQDVIANTSFKKGDLTWCVSNKFVELKKS